MRLSPDPKCIELVVVILTHYLGDSSRPGKGSLVLSIVDVLILYCGAVLCAAGC